MILIGIFLVITLGVVARFTSLRFAWTEELARWGLVSLTYVGASAALRNKQHSGVNLVINALPEKVGKVVVTIAYLVLMCTVVFFFFNSFEAAIKATRIRGDIIPLSMKYVKLLIPASFFMMFFHLAWGLGDLLSSKGISGKTIGL
jgi:TRAP-type C4-dicarboxylate transport system permease small subunit